MSTIRQLAAIMFSDIAGYTALMGKDEDKAFSLLDANRRLQKPLIEKYNGKWLKELGDGVLAQFNSAYDAVRCAIEIQESARRNFDGQLRIGIHLGDITMDDNDVFGDGVNIASRIQGIADPGGIYFTESIENAIRNRSDIQAKYLGEAALKNVDYPVKVYAVLGEDFPAPVFKSKWKEKKKIRIFSSVILIMFLALAGWFIVKIALDNVNGESRIHSLAVLPFKNLTGSDEKEYIVAGMHDALISELSHINSLRVISRTTAMRFADGKKSLSEIAKELNVGAVIESSLMESADSIRLNVQLIRTSPEEDHLWAGFYDGNIKDIFPMISQVTQRISKEIRVVLSNEEKELIAGKTSTDPDIIKLYLQGRFQLDKHTPEGFKKGFAYLDEVVGRDPLNARAWATMAMGYSDLAHLPAAPQDAFPRAKVFASKALKLDSNLLESNLAMATVNLYYDWNYVEAKKYFRKALQIDSNSAPARANYGWFLDLFGHIDLAETYMRSACDLDPTSPVYRTWLASWYWDKKRYADAEKEVQRVLAMEPDHVMATWVLGGVYAEMGKYEEAIAQYTSTSIKQSPFAWSLGKTYAMAGMRKEALEYLETAEKSPWNALGLASIYSYLGDMDNAMKWAQVVKDTRHPFTAWIAGEYFAAPLKNEPRFIEMLQPITDAMNRL